MEKDKITVIIPFYNGSVFIEDAIKSVVSQTLKPEKIIVVNDGSTDNSQEKIEEIIKNSILSIECIKKTNGGPNSARNKGLEQVKTSFVAFLDHDDTWHETKLEEQLALFQKNEKLGLVYCDYQEVDSNLKPIYSKKHTSPHVRGLCFNNLLESNKVSGSASAVLIKKECFEKAGHFDESLRNGEDWDMWLRIAKCGYEFDFIDKKLVNIRQHEHNAQKNFKLMFENELKFYSKWVQYLKKENIPFPKIWSLRIMKRVIFRLPKIDYFIATFKILPGRVIKRLIWRLI